MNIYWASLFGTGIALSGLVAAAQPVMTGAGLDEEQSRADTGFALSDIEAERWRVASQPVNHRQPRDPDAQVPVPVPGDRTYGVVGAENPGGRRERDSDRLRERILSHDRNGLRGRDRGQIGSGAAGSY